MKYSIHESSKFLELSENADFAQEFWLECNMDNT